jgi:WXG100 family type VII secretion target
VTEFRVDTSQLADVVDRIERVGVQLEQAMDQADARVDQLHETWSGSAAQAHEIAHRRWQAGATEMRDSLIVLHRIVRTAEANYSDAGSANRTMWS